MLLAVCDVEKGIRNKPSEILFFTDRLGRSQKI